MNQIDLIAGGFVFCLFSVIIVYSLITAQYD